MLGTPLAWLMAGQRGAEQEDSMAEQSQFESQFEWVRIQGEQVFDQVKKLVEEGAVTRIVIKQDERVVAEFPLALGAVAAAFAPVLAAVGAIVALLASCTIEAQRRTDTGSAG